VSRRRQSSGSSRIAWVLLFLTLAAGAGLAFYGMERYRLLEHMLGEAEQELGAIRGDVGRAERDKLDLQSQLGRAQVDLNDNRERFSQNAEEADAIKKRLAAAFGADRVAVRIADELVVLQIADSALFAKGSAKLSATGKEGLNKIGDFLIEMRERDVFVDGHTSNVPVSEVARGFDTNWEFAAARATSVLRHLHDEVGVEPVRLSSRSYAEYRPISRTSETKNRRIEIVLAPKSLQRIED